MPDHKTIIRIMGETDIVDIEMTNGQLSHPLLTGLDLADRVNLLGHWMDQDRGAALAEDPAHLARWGLSPVILWRLTSMRRRLPPVPILRF